MSTQYLVFAGQRLLCRGDFPTIAATTLKSFQQHPSTRLLVFKEADGRAIDFDFSADLEQVLAWYEGQKLIADNQKKAGKGRPKLGVVAKEVTLLPRHWDWLKSQPGGASATLRRLVDQARKASGESDVVRQSQEAAYRFMQSMGGDLSGFEEACRALFASNKDDLLQATAQWPVDVKAFLRQLSDSAFQD